MIVRYFFGVLALLGVVACQAAPAPAPAAPSGASAAPPTTPSVAPAAPAATGAPAAPSPVAASAPAALERVRVGTINNATDAPFYMAQERGYLREQGLDIELTPFDTAQRMIPPLGADQLDVGGGAPGPGLFNAIQRGVNVRIVTDRARAVPGTRFNCLVVRKSLLDSGEVRTMADLRGHVYAQNAPSTVTGYTLEQELQRVGLTPADLATLTNISFPDMLTGFGTGAVDAAILVEPFITLGEQRGVSQCWRPTSEMTPDLQIAIVLYSPVFAEQRTAAAQRFMVAYLHAMRDYYRAFFGDGEGRPELLQLLTRITGIQDAALLERLAPSWMDPNGRVNVDSLRSVQHWFFEHGDMPSEVDLDRVVDPSFVDYAITRLGPYATP
jgi:NitT/TauT family transport system substrate-binding protein